MTARLTPLAAWQLAASASRLLHAIAGTDADALRGAATVLRRQPASARTTAHADAMDTAANVIDAARRAAATLDEVAL